MKEITCPFCGSPAVEVMPADYGEKRWGTPQASPEAARAVLAAAGLDEEQIAEVLAAGVPKVPSPHTDIVYVRCGACTHTWPAPEGVAAPAPVTAVIDMTVAPPSQSGGKED